MRILYVTTSFPVFSETFLQREVRALLKAGVELEIVSLHGGESEFEGHPVHCFNKWSLLRVIWLLPILIWRHGNRLGPLLRDLSTRKPSSFLNLWENLLGLGAAIVMEPQLRTKSFDVVHCVWSGAPAACGLLLKAAGIAPFSTGAHAYDIFEHGGDWILSPKLKEALLVHVSTDVAAERVKALCSAEKVVRIRRGLNALPQQRGPREDWESLRIVCVARLVEKKGFPYQMRIYRALAQAGIPFEARIIGDGPEENRIAETIRELGLEKNVHLLGRLSEADVLENQLQWADLLFHTGIVAQSGDRDGLPNVVPEAMASGAIVLGSPVSGVVEAIEDGVTGFLCPPWEPDLWVRRCCELKGSPELRLRLSEAARRWVEREFVAQRNTGRLIESLRLRLKANPDSN